MHPQPHLLFGHIENGEMVLNIAGGVTRQCWLQIPKHFPNVVSHAFVIMPNHLHGIIEIAGVNVGEKNFSTLRLQ